MKKIIDGNEYNTETAEMEAQITETDQNGCNREEAIYKISDDRWFLFIHESDGTEQIQPMTLKEKTRWKRQFMMRVREAEKMQADAC